MPQPGKLRVALLCGGKSAEHEVSLHSGLKVAKALDPLRFDPVLLGIDKAGNWHRMDLAALEQSAKARKLLPVESERQSPGLFLSEDSRGIDVVFPVLHGPFGEDGAMQGLLKLANLPCVGAGVLGSAVGMDKDAMKRLLRDAGLPIARYRAYREHQRAEIAYSDIAAELGSPLFVKPANLGSSVGVSKARNEMEFLAALDLAFRYDRKILIEEAAGGRELECAVLGNEHPQASVVGEVISDATRHDFYSYQAKYLDEKGATLRIPANLPAAISERIRTLALQAFEALYCEGMGRVDFFLRADGIILVNEINTLPGFTATSMYPKLWEASGIGYTDLLSRLIDLAIERFAAEAKLRT